MKLDNIPDKNSKDVNTRSRSKGMTSDVARVVGMANKSLFEGAREARVNSVNKKANASGSNPEETPLAGPSKAIKKTQGQTKIPKSKLVQAANAWLLKTKDEPKVVEDMGRLYTKYQYTGKGNQWKITETSQACVPEEMAQTPITEIPASPQGVQVAVLNPEAATDVPANPKEPQVQGAVAKPQANFKTQASISGLNCTQAQLKKQLKARRKEPAKPKETELTKDEKAKKREQNKTQRELKKAQKEEKERQDRLAIQKAREDMEIRNAKLRKK